MIGTENDDEEEYRLTGMTPCASGLVFGLIWVELWRKQFTILCGWHN